MNPTDYEGDLVRLTKGEQIIQGRVSERRGGLSVIGNGMSGDIIDYCARTGWTLEIIERAKPPKPEPGVYFDVDGDVWAFPSHGEPKLVTTWSGDYMHYVDGNVGGWEVNGPFTRIDTIGATA